MCGTEGTIAASLWPGVCAARVRGFRERLRRPLRLSPGAARPQTSGRQRRRRRTSRTRSAPALPPRRRCPRRRLASTRERTSCLPASRASAAPAPGLRTASVLPVRPRLLGRSARNRCQPICFFAGPAAAAPIQQRCPGTSPVRRYRRCLHAVFARAACQNGRGSVKRPPYGMLASAAVHG